MQFELISKKELETIAKNAVSDIGEQLSSEKEGRCAHISKEIHKKLNKLGIKNNIIEILSGYIGKEEKESNVRHYYVFIYDGNIIVDTQLWQINQQPKNLNKRKVVFTYEEYQKYFRPTETNKIKTINKRLS